MNLDRKAHCFIANCNVSFLSLRCRMCRTPLVAHVSWSLPLSALCYYIHSAAQQCVDWTGAKNEKGAEFVGLYCGISCVRIIILISTCCTHTHVILFGWKLRSNTPIPFCICIAMHWGGKTALRGALVRILFFPSLCLPKGE